MTAEITVSDVSAIITAVVTGVVAIVGAVVGGVMAIRNGQKSAEKERAANQQSNDTKLDEIHTLTNSNLSKINAALSTALEKIAGLERRIEERDMKIGEQSVELAKRHPGPAIPGAATPEPVPVVVVQDQPVPVTISDQSQK